MCMEANKKSQTFSPLSKKGRKIYQARPVTSSGNERVYTLPIDHRQSTRKAPSRIVAEDVVVVVAVVVAVVVVVVAVVKSK